MIGELIDGRYRVGKQLGQGGMGAVYEAQDERENRRVALKVIVNPEASSNRDIVARFQREARAAGAIDTEHIVQVLDAGTDEATKHPYMVMEYLAGEDLSALVQRVGPLAPDVALRVVAQAALGLQRAHERGVVHRDVKPANLYLARFDDGSVLVKVLDFGIAKVAIDLVTTAENAALTRTGSMLGSPLYMSPEQAKGLRTVGPQTDVWSLGVVLYEALSGKSPNADSESLGQLILAICSEPARPIQERAPWVPPEIAQILDRALQIDVAKRFGSMQEMLAAIRALLPHFALRAEQLVGAAPAITSSVAPRSDLANASTLELAGTHAISSQRPLVQLSVPLREPKRSRWAIVSIAIGFVVVFVGGYRIATVKKRPGRTIATAPHVHEAPPVVSAVESTPEPAKGFLTVEPANVEVEIDGAKAEVTDGKVEIVGPLYSKHQVHLQIAKRHESYEVTLVPSGVAPSHAALHGVKR